jgi:integrase
MASVSKFPSRDSWRIQYFIYLKGKKIRKTKYPKTRSEARLMANQLEQLEQATKSEYATKQDIEIWVEKGWIGEDQASHIFTGFDEVIEHKRRTNVAINTIDWKLILDAYEAYSLRSGKGGEDRIYIKSHRNNMSMAKQVLSWLQENVTDLTDLPPTLIRDRLEEMKKAGSSPWTISNYLTKMRLLLDQAVILEMATHNPAREITLPQPKTASERRVLTEEEAKHLLNASLAYRDWMSGSLPTVVRLGLYAGLRNQEMCWLKWDAIDWNNRIISIRETICDETQRTWVPKDYEMRRLDVKQACIDYLAAERERQTKEEVLSPFVIPGGSKRRPQYRNRPLSERIPQRAFAKMIEGEDLNPDITIYSMRHTYATMALRSAVDLRTLQRRMGHSDIKTTMEYLHFIEPEEHPMDKLPY